MRLKVLDILLSLINQHVVSIDETMQERVAHLIEDKGYSISTAEQSTYGMLSQWLRHSPKQQIIVGMDGFWEIQLMLVTS